ncbi:uncharacterized protein LOC107879323 [Capsicum annuum]|uniref:uncharacterized protein LOC107879323 n=1 Tax=Capsicum annuum TaxID=4072 RepID=UPI001FB14888|nr:uncharacterized protein LOC107879323 [Capsicum annuum]
MAKAYRKENFDYLMAKIEKADSRVKKYLQEVGYEKCSRFHSPVKASSPYIYSVYESERRYIIDLKSESCSCWRFQIDQISCAHAIAVLKSKHVKEFGPYCSDYYKPATLVKTYEVPSIPMPDRTDWNVPNSVAKEEVLPPIFKRLPGRPKKGRKKKSSETLSLSTNH